MTNDPMPTEELRIVIIGDSTVCDYPLDQPDRGWGMYIEEYFKEGTVTVINLAKPGRSTKTFIEEGRWEQTLAENPDYILIQFGHNDSHNPANHEATDAETNYKDYLRRYIDESRQINAIPILVTPMVRRTFGDDGKLRDALPPGQLLASFVQAMRDIGIEQAVPVIELYTTTHAMIEKLGPEESTTLANKEGDTTHFNEQGARMIANLVMRELPAACPELIPLIS